MQIAWHQYLFSSHSQDRLTVPFPPYIHLSTLVFSVTKGSVTSVVISTYHALFVFVTSGGGLLGDCDYLLSQVFKLSEILDMKGGVLMY